MSTRALIILHTPNDKRFIELSCDGDSAASRLPLFDNLEKVQALLDQGNLFSLGLTVEDSRTITHYQSSFGKPAKEEPATPFTGFLDEAILDWLTSPSFMYAYCFSERYSNLPEGWSKVELWNFDPEAIGQWEPLPPLTF